MAKDPAEVLLCQRAQQAISQGNNEEAQVLYQQAMELRPDFPDAHYGMATVCFLLGDLPEAAKHFKRVTELDSARAGAFINLGAVYNRLEQFDDAIAALRRGIQLDMNRAEGYYNLGLVYRRKGQSDLAVQAYREATRINPRMADAHFNVANIYLEKSQYGLAIAHYRQALDLRPNWEKAQRGLEQAEASQGELQNKKMQALISQDAGAGGGYKPPVTTAANLDRQIDPLIHGELLRSLHRATVDSEHQGRAFLKVLEDEIEPIIKELSNCMLFPDTSVTQLNDCVHKFETAVHNMRAIQETLHASMEHVRQVGEQMLKT
jgi:tetratricopeptide (TPR) repeat protein